MNDVDLCEKFLVKSVNEFSDNIYNGTAPRDCESPYITFDCLDSEDLTVVGGVRIWSQFVYRISVHSKVSFEEISSLFESISGSLHMKPNAGSEGIVSCVRINANSEVEVSSEARRYTRFADFRIRVAG